MNQKNKSLPLSVKIPLYLGSFFGFITLGAILFESFPDSDSDIKSCKMIQSGHFKSGNTSLGLITHIYRLPNGEYRLAGLQKQNSEWGLFRLIFSSEGVPGLEPISSQSNDMENIGHFQYSLATSEGSQALIKTDQDKVFPVKISDDRISAQNIISYCGKSWGENADYQFLNANTLVANNNAGTVGFYNTRLFEGLVPRGAGTTPTALFSVINGNRLEYTDCKKIFNDPQVRVRTDRNLLAINSGENDRLALYQVLNETFQVQSNDINSGISSFTNFRIFYPEFIFFKRGSWLDKDSSWIFSTITRFGSQSEKEFEKSFEPLALKSDYVAQGEKDNGSFWLAQKSGFIFSHLIFSFINNGKVAQKYILEDSGSLKMLTSGGLWSVLPGGRHLLTGGHQHSGDYSIFDCQ